MATSKERVRRMLSLVPYVVNHPGAQLEELSRLFGASDRELRRDLNLLFLTGVPPYGPGDLIDVEIEDERVWIRMAGHLERPQTLTLPEAAALYVRGKALEGTPGYPDAPALTSALRKIEDALGEEALGELRGRVESVHAPPAGEVLEVVWRAVKEHKVLDIDYFAQSKDELTRRAVEPEKIYSALGHWYLVAWDDAAGGERLFRVDRIRSASTTGDLFEPRGLEGPGRPLYSESESDIHVRLLLHPGARWVAEYYEVGSSVERDGDLETVIPTRSLAWLAKLLVRLGPEAEILDPPELKHQVRDLAHRTLALYG